MKRGLCFGMASVLALGAFTACDKFESKVETETVKETVGSSYELNGETKSATETQPTEVAEKNVEESTQPASETEVSEEAQPTQE